MKKVIDSSEETTNVTISYFASPFFNHFSFSLNRKKCVVMRTIRAIFTLQQPICYTLE